jgi:hypothetical protein
VFEAVATTDLLGQVRAYDFGSDPVHEAGANRIDAIRELDRVIREAQAEQCAQIAALHSERTAVMRLRDGDPTLSVIGEVGMARNIGPTAAGTQVGLALGLDRLPRVFGLFTSGQISEQVARAVVKESASLVMDAPTLIGDDGEPVELVGYGPISPDVADDIIAKAPNASIRRLLVDPVDGTLVVREPRRRHFDRPTHAHIRTRDLRCHQPGCDAKIRDGDHIHEYADGGPTTVHNGQGLCKGSHQIKSQPGWTLTTHGKAVTWTTPTGHTYTSYPPPLLPRNQPGHPRQ